MKIGSPVSELEACKSKYNWSAVVKPLTELADGMALPVECDNTNQCLSLAAFVYSRINNKGPDKFKCQRRKLTVFISKVSA